MRKLTHIWSLWSGPKYPSHRIVLEWERILSDKLNIPIKRGCRLKDVFCRRFEKHGLIDFYNSLLPKHGIRLDFVMCAQLIKRCEYNKNTIPVIIDYWLDDDQIPALEEVFKYCPLVLLTNLEIYNTLKANNFRIPIEHWPLSFPDQYALTEDNLQNKKFDFTIIGRPNPFFIRLLDIYCRSHPDFTYIKNNGDIYNRKYTNNRGEVVADGKTREDYLNIIRRTKVSCYSTPGIDESKKDSNRFNQITPRVFELLSNGCQVIGHYPKDGADVKWYHLNDVIPNVDNYFEFERVLDYMRQTPMEYDKVEKFMKRHYTSTRANMLKIVLEKHNINV